MCYCTAKQNVRAQVEIHADCIGAPIILGQCTSLSAHESESMLRTYLVRRETSKRLVGEAQSVLTTAILLPQRLSCYRGKTVTAHAHQP
jgi:hypothetical protein